MKVLKTHGKYRLVETIGHYWDTRYEVQEEYGYYAHTEDTELTYAWHMSCWSHDLNKAIEMFDIRIKNL